MIADGLRAYITCVDPKKLDASFAGRAFDSQFLADLPASVDPCGENGEFHTFVCAGPMFSAPISVEAGEVVHRDGFVFADFSRFQPHAPYLELEPRTPRRQTRTKRIVSLLSSATEIFYALGLGDSVVSGTHECDFPPEAVGKPPLIRPRVDPSAPPAELDRQARELVGRSKLFWWNRSHTGRLLIQAGDILFTSVRDEFAVNFLRRANRIAAFSTGSFRTVRTPVKINAHLVAVNALME